MKNVKVIVCLIIILGFVGIMIKEKTVKPVGNPLEEYTIGSKNLQAVEKATLGPQAEKTLASLQKIEGSDLYTMEYYGDYELKRYLQEGTPDELKQITFGCSVFKAQTPTKQILLSRNHDWYPQSGLLVFTHPADGYASVTMVDIRSLEYRGENALELSSEKRKALLLVPYCPLDGMNECGLAVGNMMVPGAGQSKDPNKVSILPTVAIRLMLDYAKNVDEAIALLEKYNVNMDLISIHFLLCDAAGNSAVIEFLDGKMQVLRSDKTWQTSTNFLLTTQTHEGFGQDRYKIIEDFLASKQGTVNESEAMDLLSKTAQHGGISTVWSVVYNVSSGDIQLVKSADYTKVHNFKLSK